MHIMCTLIIICIRVCVAPNGGNPWGLYTEYPRYCLKPSWPLATVTGPGQQLTDQPIHETSAGLTDPIGLMCTWSPMPTVQHSYVLEQALPKESARNDFTYKPRRSTTRTPTLSNGQHNWASADPPSPITATECWSVHRPQRLCVLKHYSKKKFQQSGQVC